MRSVRRRFLSTLAALAASVACPSGPAQATRVFTDSAGRTVVLPARVERIYAAGPPASILYPDAFPEDLRPIVRDFYTRCYHQTPSESQLDQLLRNPAPA